MEPDSKHDEFNPSTTPHVPAHDHRAERCPPPRRRRRRGPRSIEALERRSRLRLTPPSVARGEARAVSPDTAGGVPFVPMSSSTSSTTPCPTPSPTSASTTRAATGAAGQAAAPTVAHDAPGDLRAPAAAASSSVFSRCVHNSRSDSNFVNRNSFFQHVRIWSVNVRKLLRRKAELEARLRNADVHVLLLQETWLSESVEEVSLDNYVLVSRMDRLLGPKRGYGGVAIYVRSDVSSLVALEQSDSAERSWALLHTNIGSFLVGNWYRPPDDDGSSMQNLGSELERLREDCVGVILIGDVNIHHRRWLRHSSQGNTPLGERLWSICRENSLKQVVTKPTRGDNLLDLVLTDVSALLKVQVLPELSDHRIVSIDLEVVVARSQAYSREVWDFKRAQWDSLRSALTAADWHSLLHLHGAKQSPDESVQRFVKFFVQTCESCIPKKQITDAVRDHPWIDDTCMAAIEAKCLATGSAELGERERECNEVLKAAFLNYQTQLRTRILNLPKSSKEWWRLNRELLNRRSKHSTIPPLKTTDGKWILEAERKADLLANTFQSKSRLPDPLPDSRPEDLVSDAEPAKMSDFLLIRSRWALKVLKKLTVGKASGPDNLPIRIFKECAAELAPAIAILVRFLLRHRLWPSQWRMHRIHPLYKKGAVSAATNYRGVHLTDVLSKVVERVIARHLTPFFDRIDAYGVDQWAFRKKRSCRDLVALLVCRWLWALDNGFKVGIYLSDISGAFDRVDREILIERLRRTGLSDTLLEFLYDYLAPRQAVVVVQGKNSHPFSIEDEIFQGTVLGPPLWNVFFKPVARPIVAKTFRAAKFADDLTAYKNFESSTANAQITESLHELQDDVHEWGRCNRVTFDPSKEHFCILHRADFAGDTFKLLGTLLDPKLLMEDEIRRIRKKASPKIKAILATRGYYLTDAMIQQYKAHVLCILEASAAAIYHASQSHLDSLDKLQTHFVEALGLTESEAFLRYNLAPPKLRRDIAVLGLLHRVQLGHVHADFQNLFPRQVHACTWTSRLSQRRHGKQFAEMRGNSHYYNHSVFGATRVYNLLPSYAANAESVETFQSWLTKDARFQCQTGNPHWIRMYCCRARSF